MKADAIAREGDLRVKKKEQNPPLAQPANVGVPPEKKTLIVKRDRKLKYSFIGKTINEFREKRGWSQGQLAEAAQLTQAQLSNYENGKTLPTSDMLFEICEALEIDPVDFTARSLEIKKEIIEQESSLILEITPELELIED
ncbi:helix-turn-helix domain-containing protein [Runella slithyformis]|uniref:Helix-turn-helix domain protein n=1 Tax=Runella slithyformis (strain ATCC 29530 / DSM 19594 / LMG 11500 / NCIMB 11436 / LSU 4) TaxID=761193 RepID=A0A7U3ZIX5_RUNSL|nr:helix-turn-helix transcriptional regulator [Runella slithyformis]AEI48076.1 helix-turn-helix domain protein [Runella slithyformis DSM 19594]